MDYVLLDRCIVETFIKTIEATNQEEIYKVEMRSLLSQLIII